MLKILQARVQQYVNVNFQMFKLDLEKAEEPKIKLPTSVGLLKKQESFRNVCFIGYAKDFDCVDDNKLWKIFQRWEYQTTLPASWEICMQVKKQQLELDMKQQTGSNRKRNTSRLYTVTVLIYMQSTSWETLSWMKHSWNQDCWEKYQ